MINRIFAGLAGVFVLTACATAETGDYEMSEKAAARLADFDRTGEMTDCLSTRRIRSLDAIDDRNLLVRTSTGYYLNELSGRCSGASGSFNRLQYSTTLGQLCRHEIIKVVDNSSGFTVGGCGLGSFERLEKKPAE